MKGFPKERAVGWATQTACHWLTVLGLMLMGLVSGFPWLTQDPSWWCTHGSAKMDASGEDSGRLVGHEASPFDLSLVFLVVLVCLVTKSCPSLCNSMNCFQASLSM